ncbi:MAG: hypothetical protein LBB56_07290 [Chitinispirillales bacterium]|jgi:predicted nucleic acid-binding protein|nr:hypothetical protein [Chitinispirillales bacterium]
MRKLKLYLDTSVISHLFAEDTPEKMADTNGLWQDFIDGKYEVFVSTWGEITIISPTMLIEEDE